MRARLFPLVSIALAAANALVLACGGAAAPVGATAGGPDVDATVDGAKSAPGSDSATGTGTTDGAGGDDAASDGNPDDGASSGDATGDGAIGDGGASDAASTDGTAVDGNGADAKSDGAPDSATDGAGAADAGPIPCEDAGILEVEPNGTLATATPMAAPIAGRSSICGRFASGADLEFVRFKLKPGSTNLYWEWTGGVTPEFSVGGVVQPTVTFQTAEPYVVQIKLNSGVAAPLTWRFTYVEQ